MKQALYRPRVDLDPTICKSCRTEWAMCSCDLDAERASYFRAGFKKALHCVGWAIVILMAVRWLTACRSAQDLRDAQYRAQQSAPYYQLAAKKGGDKNRERNKNQHH